MIVHQVFAQIFEGEVKNIMVCDNYSLANYISKATYGKNAFAVDCLQYGCGLGDRYHDGAFFHVNEDGTEKEIYAKPTQEMQVQQLQDLSDNLAIIMADMIGGAYNAQ